MTVSRGSSLSLRLLQRTSRPSTPVNSLLGLGLGQGQLIHWTVSQAASSLLIHSVHPLRSISILCPTACRLFTSSSAQTFPSSSPYSHLTARVLKPSRVHPILRKTLFTAPTKPSNSLRRRFDKPSLQRQFSTHRSMTDYTG